MRKIKVGIIGQGRSGRGIHAVTLIKLMQDKYQIVAVCDPIAERCEPSKNETGCATYTDYREMLKDRNIDLFINASPSNLHVPITHEILDAGFDVVTEKPLARRVSDVDGIIAKAKKTKRLFTIFQQSRFAPYFLKVREIIDSGVLGRVAMIKIAFNNFARRWDWQTLQEMDAGILLNTGPHPLDQALQLFGEAEPDVFCLMDKVNSAGDAEDHVKLILSAKGSPTIDLEISCCCAYPLYTYQVYGSHGSLTGDMKKIEWKYFIEGEAPEMKLIREPLPNLGWCSEKLPWKNGEWNVPAEESNLFDCITSRYYGALYETIVNKSTLAITPAQVRRQIAVIEECHRQNPLPRMKS